jgi:RNA polymerase sigma factor (sigma-70 family)
MSENDWLAQQFEENRGHLRGVAYRMLGSLSEAEDAVQESWLRLTRSDTDSIDNLGAWLTTVVARVCLDMLRQRKSRREDSLSNPSPEPAGGQKRTDPEQEALLANSVGVALLIVLDRLNPAERLAFVLHDIFDLPFDEIAPILSRTPVAVRQLASRARRQVRGRAPVSGANLSQQRQVVSNFLAALQSADLQALLAVLDPEMVVHADSAASGIGKVHSAEDWARQAITLAQGARAAQLALVNGTVGLVVAPRGRLLRVVQFVLRQGKIREINVVGESGRLGALDIAVLEEAPQA